MNFKFLLRTTIVGGIIGGCLGKVYAQPNASELSNTGIATITTEVPKIDIRNQGS